MLKDQKCPTCKLVLHGEENPRTASENAYVQLIQHFRTVHAGTGHTCGRRMESLALDNDAPNSDFFRSDDNRCSYCGSMSEEEFFRRADAGETITPTDKSYKVYVGHTGKFYFQHLSENGRQMFVDYVNAGKFKLSVPGYFYTRPYFVKTKS